MSGNNNAVQLKVQVEEPGFQGFHYAIRQSGEMSSSSDFSETTDHGCFYDSQTLLRLPESLYASGFNLSCTISINNTLKQSLLPTSRSMLHPTRSRSNHPVPTICGPSHLKQRPLTYIEGVLSDILLFRPFR